MKFERNPYFSQPDALPTLRDIPMPSTDAEQALMRVQSWENYSVTPLETRPELARQLEVSEIYLKNESPRMGLGNFKALGAAYAIACQAEDEDLSDVTYVCASAGNHGLSVAVGAQSHGAQAVIYLDENVPEIFSERLKSHGAHVIRYGNTYEIAMKAAFEAAETEGWRLLSDQSTATYLNPPRRVMEGYLVMMAETIEQLKTPPTHIFVQAGVGGMAASVAALARKAWGEDPIICVVEPAIAPALYTSILEGKAVHAGSGVSEMGRLDCKEPSLIALKGLARDANFFMLIDEDEGQHGASLALKNKLPSTPSGAAGLAGLIGTTSHKEEFGIDQNSRILVFISEGPAE